MESDGAGAPVYSISSDDLTPAELELLRAASVVASRAYNPVSRFYVGAAARAANGKIYLGTFFESSSFPLGICAESAALAAAITDGTREIKAIAVAGGDPESASYRRPVTPCGGCRQRIFDVTSGSETNVLVLCANLDLTRTYRLRIADLLPLPFGEGDLPASIR